LQTCLQAKPPLKLISGFACLLGLDLLPESLGVLLLGSFGLDLLPELNVVQSLRASQEYKKMLAGEVVLRHIYRSRYKSSSLWFFYGEGI
jgi:hypothetical protein